MLKDCFFNVSEAGFLTKKLQGWVLQPTFQTNIVPFMYGSRQVKTAIFNPEIASKHKSFLQSCFFFFRHYSPLSRNRRQQWTSPHDVVEWDFTSGSDSEPYASPAKIQIEAKRLRNKKGRLERNLSFADSDQVGGTFFLKKS